MANTLAIDEPLEYARLYLDGNMQMWVMQKTLELELQVAQVLYLAYSYASN